MSDLENLAEAASSYIRRRTGSPKLATAIPISLALAVLGILSFGVMWMILSHRDGPPAVPQRVVSPPRKPDPFLKPITAQTMAEKFVRNSLRSPSTASFGSFFGESQDPRECVTDLGGGHYRVVGWVDAQNGFGAMIRSNFVCEVQDLGNDQWMIVNCRILPR